MRSVSEDWAGLVAGGARMALRVEVLSGDGVELEVESGSVTLDSQSAVRGRLDLSLPGVDWVPRDAQDLLAPYGNEIRVWRGVYLPDGSSELVSLGVFGIEDVEVTDDGSVSTRVTGLDRANRISLAKFEDVFALAAGTPVSEGIEALALSVWPDCPVSDDLAGMAPATLPKVVAQAGDDPWEFMQGLAKAVGMVLFFDGDGVLTLKPYADEGVVATVAEGDGGVLLEASRDWSRTDSFNRVVATGENTDNADVYRGVATDDNPDSPTYYYGAFGRVPYFYSSEYISSDDQAQDAANAILSQEIGTASTVSFGMVPNPALEPEDTVLVQRERVGINENHILDSVTIGLSAGDPMTASTRQRLEV